VHYKNEEGNGIGDLVIFSWFEQLRSLTMRFWWGISLNLKSSTSNKTFIRFFSNSFMLALPNL
jgi:hypothetical protein